MGRRVHVTVRIRNIRRGDARYYIVFTEYAAFETPEQTFRLCHESTSRGMRYAQ